MNKKLQADIEKDFRGYCKFVLDEGKTKACDNCTTVSCKLASEFTENILDRFIELIKTKSDTLTIEWARWVKSKANPYMETKLQGQIDLCKDFMQYLKGDKDEQTE